MMQKIDATVRRETMYIAAAVGVMSLLLQSVFLIAGQWHYTVLLGNLLSGAAAVANFFLMGLTVQNALQKEEKQAADAVKLSQRLRLLMMFVVAAVGVALPCFDTTAVILPFFFPRVAIAVRPLLDRRGKDGKQEGDSNE